METPDQRKAVQEQKAKTAARDVIKNKLSTAVEELEKPVPVAVETPKEADPNAAPASQAEDDPIPEGETVSKKVFLERLAKEKEKRTKAQTERDEIAKKFEGIDPAKAAAFKEFYGFDPNELKANIQTGFKLGEAVKKSSEVLNKVLGAAVAKGELTPAEWQLLQAEATRVLAVKPAEAQGAPANPQLEELLAWKRQQEALAQRNAQRSIQSEIEGQIKTAKEKYKDFAGDDFEAELKERVAGRLASLPEGSAVPEGIFLQVAESIAKREKARSGLVKDKTLEEIAAAGKRQAAAGSERPAASGDSIPQKPNPVKDRKKWMSWLKDNSARLLDPTG